MSQNQPTYYPLYPKKAVPKPSEKTEGNTAQPRQGKNKEAR